MALEGYTSNFPDPDLTPENVRKDKTIFGVEGTFEGGVGTLGVGRSYISVGTTYQLPQYLVQLLGASSLNSTYNFYQQHNEYVVIGIGMNNTTGGVGTIIIRIDVTTGECSTIFTHGGITVNVRYENGNIYYNTTGGGDYHYIINIDDRTETGSVGHYNTGDIPQNTAITIGENTFTVSTNLYADLWIGGGVVKSGGILVS